MKIKNYTSSVPVDRTISMLEACLVSAGAKDILKNYEGGKLAGISFQLDVNGKPIAVRLPAKIEVIEKILLSDMKRMPNDSTRQRIVEQAERTAWKLVLDWVQVQNAMIRLGQADFLEVFLPYVWMPNTQSTYYQELKGSNFKMLPVAK